MEFRFTTASYPNLVSSLVDGDAFEQCHLIKFERPKPTLPDGSTNQEFAYVTDASRNIAYSGDTYVANKVVSISGIQESTTARATTMSLKLSAAALGTTTVDYVSILTGDPGSISGIADFALAGFREGDKVEINGASNSGKHIIIDKFQKASGVEVPNSKIVYTPVDTISADSDEWYTFNIASEELQSLLTSKTSTLYSNYINREVYIYRAHIDPADGSIIDTPFLIFKGIISQGSIEEKPGSHSIVSWGLTSHWGDFVRVQGRFTSDSSHRALDLTGKTDRDALLRPEYESDYGFAHAERSINVMATYMTEEIRYKERRSGNPLKRALGIKKLKEYTVEVEQEVDLRFNLGARMLPVVYGVNRVSGIPVFADLSYDSANTIYVAHALCEGEIGGLYDVIIDEQPSVCATKADYDVRHVNTVEEGTVDVFCRGRADRGYVLSGDDYTDNTTWADSDMDYLPDLEDRWLSRYPGMWSPIYPIRFEQTDFVEADEGTPNGITHEKGYRFTSPNDMQMVFHAGKTDQDADQMLVQQAATAQSGGGFKVQKDYYEGDSSNYWGPSHRLLDTAYTVTKLVIDQGEETIPQLEYVVKGKYIQCHNYDYSFKHNAEATSDASSSAFVLGQSVNLSTSSDGSSWTPRYNSAQIIDKWVMTDKNGAADVRFRWRSAAGELIDLTSYTKIRMDDGGGNTWTMFSAEDEADSGTVTSLPSVPLDSTTPFSYTSGELYMQLDSGDSNYSTLNNILTATADNTAQVAFTTAANAVFTVASYSAGKIYVAALPGAKTVIEAEDAKGGEILLINAVRITDASDVNPAADYIDVTRDTTDGDKVIKKKVSATTAAYNVVWTEGPFSPDFVPTSPDTYVVGAKNDERVSINPAIQLLDYMTNTRYGKGLNIDTEINKTTFLESARLCDDKSKIIVVGDNAGIVGDTYQWLYGDSTVAFQGRCTSSVARGSYYEITFDDVIGKLGRKWADWKEWKNGELIWGGDNHVILYGGSSGQTMTKDAFLAQSKIANFDLDNISTPDSDITVNVDRLGGVSGTNSIVRAWTTGTEFSSPGYTLHDSDDVVYWKYVGWDEQEQRYVTRHQMNQIINTSESIFDNINTMLEQFNGILRYTNGQYALDIKTAAPPPSDSYWTYAEISEDDIIGSIKLDDKGQKKSFNSVSASIIDPQNKFTSRSVSFFNSTYLKEDKGVPKSGNYGLPGITNYYVARTNIKQFLDESRYGLTISFVMRPKGYMLLAGNPISLTYERFGWQDKLFRIETITARSDGLIAIVANEHNDDAYLIDDVDRNPADSKVEGGEGPAPATIEAPYDLTASTDRDGEILLNWVNTENFDRNKYKVEIWAAECIIATDGTYDLNSFDEYYSGGISTAVFVGSSETDYFVHKPVDNAKTFVAYAYWIRYVKPATEPNTIARYSPFHPDPEGEGVIGSAGLAPLSGYTFYWTNQTVVLWRATNGVINDLNPTAFQFAVYKGKEQLIPVDPGAVTVGEGQFGITVTGDSLVTPDDDPYDPLPVDNIISVDPVTYIGDNVTFCQVQIDVNLEGTWWEPSLFQNIYVNYQGRDAWDIVGTNLEHIFLCDSDGSVFDNDFSCTFEVRLGGQEYSYDDSTYPGQTTYSYGNITNSANVVVNVSAQGVITIDGTSSLLDPGPISETGWIDVPILDYLGQVIFSKYIYLKKMYSGVRGGSEFFIEAPGTYVTTTDVTNWAGTLDATAAQNVAREIIEFLAPDGFIRPNDRITLAWPGGNKAGTRIYTGVGTNIYTTVNENAYSSLVVEIFDGSVIVDGTMSADKLVTDFIIANNARIGSNLVVGAQASTDMFGQLYSYQKTSFNDTSAGFFMDEDGYFAVGDGQNYLKFSPDGALELRGNLIAGGNYQLVTWDWGADMTLNDARQRINKSGGANAYGVDSWVRSNTSIAAGATASIVPSSTSAEYIWGLSNSISAGQGGDGIDYGFKMNVGGTFDIWVAGAVDSGYTGGTSFGSGDFFEVVYQEMEAGPKVFFYKNNTNIYEVDGASNQAYFWEGNFKTTGVGYVTYSMGMKEAPNPSGTPGSSGAGFYTITESIPDAVDLTGFNAYITINGYDTSGNGGIFAASGREYAVKGDICVVKDSPHPDVGTGERVQAFICTYGPEHGNEGKWHDSYASTSYWEVPEAFIDGELIVTGTIHGDALVIYGDEAGDAIQIGPNDKERIDIYSNGNLRVRLGDLEST